MSEWAARALSSFECMTLAFVAPRMDVQCRKCMSNAKGAQYIIRDASEGRDSGRSAPGLHSSQLPSRAGSQVRTARGTIRIADSVKACTTQDCCTAQCMVSAFHLMLQG